MASLHKLLSEQGFERHTSSSHRKPKNKVKFKDSISDDSIALPIFICRDRRSFDASSWRRSQRTSSSLKSSRKGGSVSEISNSTTTRKHPGLDRGEPAAIDDVAIKAVVSILTGFVGRYSKDDSFRRTIREKSRSCFLTGKNKEYSDAGILARMELGIQTIENLVRNQENGRREMDLDSVQNAIKLLKIIASLDSDESSHISACSNLYLSIVYKISKNDKVSAKHLLQVFSDSPFLARTHLLPELWEHLFLPHLLHFKIWYSNELEFLSNSDYVDKKKKIMALNEQYHDLMDKGTAQFALYYKEWLKVGGQRQAPSIPSVPLPSKPSYARSRRRSSNQSATSKSLYQEVFGHSLMKGRSMDLDNDYRASGNVWDIDEGEEEKGVRIVEKKGMADRRSSSQCYSRMEKPELWPDRQKPDYFRLMACQTIPAELMVKQRDVKHDENESLSQLNEIMSKAIDTICTSESLSECEMAVRAVTDGWMKSQGDPAIEALLSQPSVIEGIMEVLFVSEDDEILELAISILADLAAKRGTNRQCILKLDPKLEVSIKLLRNNHLFLKAAALLHQIKPKPKQMMLLEWIPLALRVLEFGDQSQTLFSVRCNPHEVAYYLFEQLLTGFDEDKNIENARQLVSLGGLRLLTRRMDIGDTCEKCKAASVLHYCIRADGSCRHYLSKNLNKENVISLLVREKHTNVQGHALALLTELLCLSRTKQRIETLTTLRKGWNCLNTMHILLLYLQRARPEERPIAAVVLLLLDLMGDHLEFSICREEAIDVIVKVLDCCVLNEDIQEQSARALLILGGHFSYNGEPEVEKWLLRKAGFCTDSADNPFYLKYTIKTKGYIYLENEEDKITENWQRRAAIVLFTSGNRRLLTALSDSIANGIPRLSRASLATVCWMSDGLHDLGDEDLQLVACKILVPQLIECLSYNRSLEERILASFALLGLAKGTDYFSCISPMKKEIVERVRKLFAVTWTAKEIISLIKSR